MHPAGLVLIVAVVLMLLLICRSEWEKKQLKVEEYRFQTDKAVSEARFVFLSDLHSMRFGEDNEELLQEIRRLSPDAVLIGGDMITCGRRTANPPRTNTCIHLVEALAADYPVYYAEGNHELRFKNRFPDDYEIFVTHLDQIAGVEYLNNRTVEFDFRDELEERSADIDITGVSVEQAYYDVLRPGFGRKRGMPQNYLRQKAGEPDETRFNILLLHSPMYLKEAAAWGADLVLSGHFHGGTIRLPKLGGLMTPQYQFLVRECAGVIKEGKASLIVSRGLGTHSVPIRLNNLPEIACIDITGRLS